MPDEKTHADSLRVYLTGAASDGAAQADPDAALGNYRSATEAEQLAASIASAISNVTLDFVAGANGPGTGTLAAKSADTLAWTAPGGSEGAAVTIANGETKILEDGTDPEKYVRVTRTSTTALTGSATVTLTDAYNNLVGMDNISSAEAAAGDDEYRCLALKNESASQVKSVKAWIGTLGTQMTSSAAQLGASGAGTIEGGTGDFADWPDTGFAHIKTSAGATREVVYYSSRTDDVLTVPAAGREMLGTSAAAGASDDTVDAVPGIAIAKEAPTAQPDGHFTDETGAGEGSDPGVSFSVACDEANGEDIGDLDAGEIYGLWIWRAVPAGQVADTSLINLINWSFDAA